MKSHFIIAISKHRVLGEILMPYLIEQVEGKSFYMIVRRVTREFLETSGRVFSPTEKELVKLTDEYNDEVLKKRFSKKMATAQEFFSKVTEERLRDHIIPFVEKRIVKCIDILKELVVQGNEIELYNVGNTGNLHETDKVKILPEPAEAVFNFELSDVGFKYFLSIFHEGRDMKLTGQDRCILSNDPCRLLLDSKLYSFHDIDGKKLVPFFKKEFISIPLPSVKKYMETFVFKTIKNYRVNVTGFEVRELDIEPVAFLFFESDLRGESMLSLKFRYGDKHFVSAGKETGTLVSLEQTKGRYIFSRVIRSDEKEQAIAAKLVENRLRIIDKQFFKPESVPGIVSEEQKYGLINWVNSKRDFLERNNITVDQKYFSGKYYLNDITLIIKPSGEDDWFDIYAVVLFGVFKIPFINLKNYILSGTREYILPDGKIAILPAEWFSEFYDLLLLGEENKDNIKLNKHFFQVINTESISTEKKYLESFVKILQAENLPIALPTGLNAKLRPYQKIGFSWMHQLRKNGFGGCLADDMGLGKTLQALTVILKAHEENPASKKPKPSNSFGQLSLFDSFIDAPVATNVGRLPASLIVMPTSLIHNWENEINKFTPGLSYFKHVGNTRLQDIEEFNNYNIIITTYGVVRNDIELMKKYSFFYTILDESQYIKNPDSKIYKAITRLESANRLVLTGTPIENSLKDLWSQINFLNRGLLGNLTFFKENYIFPIEKKRDEVQMQKLRKLISPFILRRTKMEVAKDLPPLTEQVIFCKMSDRQQSLYEEEKSRIRNAILHIGSEGKLDASRFFILQGLTKLRLISSHPVMAMPEYADESGKFTEITQNLESLLAGKHKVLVFSSFVKHLKLFENYCLENGLIYSLLTGNTRKRKEVIEGFQENEENRIFLISIKAGGTGLNLTSADYVFVLDPWWNPAVESQAVSRAHRIGQNKKVFVYKFITKDTVEEKIHNLQKRKVELADMFVKSNNPFNSFSMDEIMDLFE